MKKLAVALIAIVAVFASASAFAREIVVTDAKIAGGALKVSGMTPGPKQKIKLDGDFSVTSDASRNFSFVLTDYFPLSCVAHLAVGASHTATAVVANCATLKRGADISGAISLSGIANGRCSQVDLAISGAKVGEMPLITPEAATQNGILLYAFRVSSDNHVTMNACNFTGGAMTAISNLPIRVLTLP